MSRSATVPDIIDISDDDGEIKALKVSTGAMSRLNTHIYHSEQARLQVLEGKRMRHDNASTGSSSRKKIKLERNKREIIKVEDPGQVIDLTM